MSDDSSFQLPDVAGSNARHDREHGDYRDYNDTRIRSAWNEARLMRRRPLTDKQIRKYEALGYYSSEFRDARRALQDRKSASRARREGNFDLVDGRMIYNPA